jgi:hypothetical protein
MAARLRAQFWSPQDYAAFLADETALAAAEKTAGIAGSMRAIIGFSSAGHHVNRERPLLVVSKTDSRRFRRSGSFAKPVALPNSGHVWWSHRPPA